MKYIRTLNQIQHTEYDKYGIRACDLGKLQTGHLLIPPTFIITSDAWEEFLNKIRYKINFILEHTNLNDSQTLDNAYGTIRRLIIDQELPDKLIKELKEAYESLNIGMKVSISEMVKEDNAPFVNLYLSTNYDLPAESYEGIIQNIHGMEELLLALKEAYAMNYTREAIRYRAEENISDKFKVSIIIQEMKLAHASAHGYSTDPTNPANTIIFSYRGFMDLRDIIPKDYFLIVKEFLNILKNQIIEQSKIIIREEDTHLEIKEYNEGREQSLNDKEIMELARLTKRSEKILENPCKVFFTISNGEYFILFVNKYAIPNYSIKTNNSSDYITEEDENNQEKEDINKENEYIEIKDHDKQEEYIEIKEEDNNYEMDKNEDSESLIEDDQKKETIKEQEKEENQEKTIKENYNENTENNNYEEKNNNNNEEENYNTEKEENKLYDEKQKENNDNKEENDKEEYPVLEEKKDYKIIDLDEEEAQEKIIEEQEKEEENYDENTENNNYEEKNNENNKEEENQIQEKENNDNKEEKEETKLYDEKQKENMKKSFRIIYSELVKLYEKNGEEAPDTLNELIQSGTKKGYFNIEGLQNILEIKRKIRREEPISDEEEELILEVLNKLLE